MGLSYRNPLRTKINWLEGSFPAVVEANAELDLRGRALAKISDAVSTVCRWGASVTVVSIASVASVASVAVVAIAGIAIAVVAVGRRDDIVGASDSGAWNRTTLVIDGGDGLEVLEANQPEDGRREGNTHSRLAEHSVESICLSTSLGRLSSSCGSGSLASSFCLVVGFTRVDQLITNESSDDGNVLSRTMRVGDYRKAVSIGQVSR